MMQEQKFKEEILQKQRVQLQVAAAVDTMVVQEVHHQAVEADQDISVM